MSPEDFQREFQVSAEALGLLHIYHDLLVKWQKAINLVSPKTIPEIWERHFADSAQLVPYLAQRLRTADLGSGAGLPGMVLAILRPDLDMHLIESDERKCQFLKTVSRETKVPVVIHNDRVQNVLNRIAPGLIIARAFAPLEELLAAAGWPEQGADMLLLKGKTAAQEVEQAKKKYALQAEFLPVRKGGEGQILRVGTGIKNHSGKG